MSASTALITDIGTVVTNGPNSATQAKAIVHSGPIQDYVANTKLVQLKLREASVLLAQIVTDTDSSDSTNLTLINGLAAALGGTSSPSGTLITDATTALTNGANAATKARAILQSGPIMDYQGNLNLVKRKFQEANVLLKTIDTATDSSDSANKALVASLLLALV